MKEVDKVISNFRLDKRKNARKILNGALSYRYRRAEKPIEYRNGDIERFMVNHIRHSYSTYNNDLRRIHRIDDNDSEINYIAYKNNVLNEISQKYPYLDDECKKQKLAIHMIQRR